MTLEFPVERWPKIIEDTKKWWDGTLDRPLIQARLKKNVKTDFHFFQSFYPLDVPVEKVIDECEQYLNSFEYFGDAFPHFFPNFGAGVIAAFLGASLTNGENTVWFHPPEDKEVKDIHFEYDPENKWFLRVKDVISAGLERWNGNVQIGMTDLGGNLDILSTFRPGEKLLLDLYDYPDEVERLTWESHEIWWRYFRYFENLTEGKNHGYSTWAMILSDKPHYMLQCDFCYMIGPDMFERFVKPELKACCDKLTNAFFHLDGPGQLAHLDSILEIESLKGIQWIPGAGSPGLTEWPEVFRKISDSGKKIQLLSHLSDKPFDETLDIITDQIGRADNIEYNILTNASEQENIEKLIAKYF